MDDPAARGTSLTLNGEDTIQAGGEALVGASFALGDSEHRIEPLLSMTYNDFTFDNDPVYGDNQLPVAPNFFIKGEVMYRHGNGFFAGPTFDIVDDRYGDFANNKDIDGYELLGLRTGVTRDSWEVYLEGRNLTDEVYVTNVSVSDNENVNPVGIQAGEPRSVYAGVRFEF